MTTSPTDRCRELMSCPFCNAVESKPYITEVITPWMSRHYAGLCDNCGASSCIEITPELAAASWNTRANPAPQPEINGGQDVVDIEYLKMELDHLCHVSVAAINESPIIYFDRAITVAKAAFAAMTQKAGDAI